jgi:prepilin-type N-terminal cleavage/methylation domain-containing protein
MRHDSSQVNSSQVNSSQVHSSLRRDLGFSLLEVMVAISVLSIVVLGVSLIPALGLGRNNDTRTYAVNVAREVLDSYRSLLLDHNLWTSPTIPVESQRPNLPQNLRFGCTLQIPVPAKYGIDPTTFELSPTLGIPKVLQITVVITCPQAGGTSFSTYIGDPSPAGS